MCNLCQCDNCKRFQKALKEIIHTYKRESVHAYQHGHADYHRADLLAMIAEHALEESAS